MAFGAAGSSGRSRRRAGARLPALLVAALVASIWACAPGATQAEREIHALVEEALAAVRAADAARLSRLYLGDPRYERDPRAPAGDDVAGERVRLADFCATPGFEHDPPQVQIALLKSRAVVTLDLTYRFARAGALVERQARVTLFLERRLPGWGILRDSVAFPSEPHPQPPG